MNNVGLEVVFWTILALYLLTKLGVFKNEKIQKLIFDTRMLTLIKGEINWKDGDDIEVQLKQKINLLLHHWNHILTSIMIMRKRIYRK